MKGTGLEKFRYESKNGEAQRLFHHWLGGKYVREGEKGGKTFLELIADIG